MTIGCLWCCICAMAWIADCESVKMTMLFTHGALGLSQSLEMVCKAECIAFTSASYVSQCCPHASLMYLRVASGYWMVIPYPAYSTAFRARKRSRKPKELQADRSPLLALQASREDDPHSPSVQDRAQANHTAGRF